MKTKIILMTVIVTVITVILLTLDFASAKDETGFITERTTEKPLSIIGQTIIKSLILGNFWHYWIDEDGDNKPERFVVCLAKNRQGEGSLERAIIQVDDFNGDGWADRMLSVNFRKHATKEVKKDGELEYAKTTLTSLKLSMEKLRATGLILFFFTENKELGPSI